jgi:hypothetical protein
MGQDELYVDGAYRELKDQLDDEARALIERVEKLCLDRTLDYFKVYNQALQIVYGEFPHRIVKGVIAGLDRIGNIDAPLHRLLSYLVRRAGQIRGLKFKM